MSTAPNCNKNKEHARMRRAGHLEQNQQEERWLKTLNSNKYPKCVGKNLFDDCPKDVPKNVPSTCKSCPQYTPPLHEKRERMRKLIEDMKK